MIRFSCPGCSATYTVGDEKGGKTGKCPKCQSQFVIPLPEGGAVADTPSAPPPLPPAPAADSGTVEISPCPSCQTRLTVETGDLGSDVQCPTCNTVFKATRPGATPPVPPPAPPKKSRFEDAGRREKDEEDDDDRPRKKRRNDDDDEEEDRPSKKRRDDDDDEEDRPSKKRRDDDDDDRPRNKKKRRRSGGEPHRGTTILILGILAFVGCGIFTAIPALVMANADLKKMDDGSMDEEGRSLTNIGRVLGLVSIVLTLLSTCGFVGLLALGGAGR